MRIPSPTAKVAEFTTEKDVLPEDAAAERVVRAV
jgi:hypothetical protein